jgi:hypothetical protein
MSGTPRGGTFAPNVGPDERDPRGGMMPTGASVGVSGLPIDGDMSSNPDLYEIASRAWSYVMPQGSRIEVFSAHRPGGSATSQHHSADAIDFRVIRPDGSRVRWDDPEALRGAEFGVAMNILGVGAGFDYMGGDAFHWDRGTNPNNPRGGVQVWSDSDGVNNRDARGAVSWLPRLQAAQAAGVNGLLAAAGLPPMPAPEGQGVAIAGPDETFPGESTPPTMMPTASSQGPVTQIRNAQGGLETRPLDIFTSRYDIIRQNAALGGFSARVLNDASLAMSDLRRRFPTSPGQFEEAANAYVQQVMQSAPATIRQQLSADLRAEAARNLNGVRDEQFQQTMATANAEARARTEILSTEYSTLLAAGDTDGAAAARGQLEEILRYRASLPGSTLGPDQIDLVVGGAERAAVSMRQTNATNRTREVGNTLTSIRRAAADGRSHVDEGLLDNPDFQAHPDFQLTMGAVNMRDFIPDFEAMPPSERQRMIEDESARPVQDERETGFLDAMRNTHEAALRRESEDPMANFHRNGIAIGTLDPSDAGAFAETMMNRAEIAAGMVEQGYTDEARFFTNEERDELALMFGADADPTVRAGFANMLLDTLGPQAASAAIELGVEQSTAGWIGLAALSGNRANLAQSLTGAAMRRAGQARTVPQDVTMGASIISLLEALPPNAGLREQIVEMALDHSAFTEGMGEPDEAAFLESVRAALGQNGDRGGVQQIFRGQTLLPPNVSGTEAQRALQAAASHVEVEVVEVDGAFYALPPGAGSALESLGSEYASGWIEANGITGFESEDEASAGHGSLWGEGGPPLIAGEPMSIAAFNVSQLVPVTRQGSVVAGLYHIQGNGWDATDSDGNLYVLRLQEVMERYSVR